MLCMRCGRFMCTGCLDAFDPKYMQGSGHPKEEEEEKEAEIVKMGARLGCGNF